MQKVLLVDDLENKLNQLVWTFNSLKEKPLIHTASCYHDAIEEIEKDDFDLIVTDMVMEERDSGYKILRASKEKNQATEVIIVTDYENPKIELASLKDGVNSYFKRDSFTFISDLCQRLNQILSVKALNN